MPNTIQEVLLPFAAFELEGLSSFGIEIVSNERLEG